MIRHINAHFLPSWISPEHLADRTVVVVDVLRATTTIVYALARGAKEVIPCLTVEDAWQAYRDQAGPVVLGGERGGLAVEGFHLGNSPTEYTTEAIGGKCIVFTTSNGTKAMMQCRLAKRTLIGAFANLSALINQLEETPGIEILCAGSRGEVTREDVLLAGAIVDRLSGNTCVVCELNDQANLAADAWRGLGISASKTKELAAVLRESRGGRRLVEIGMHQDIETAACVDASSVLPELDPQALRIRPWCS